MKRIGEILLEHGWVERASLDRALAGQRHTGKRLCSVLIGRGELDPDHAARALGEQLGIAAVLQKHLEHREKALAKLLPPAVARAHCALPIGRMRDHALVVCVRDGRPEVRAALAQALPTESLVLAVAPAHQLEALIAQEYEPDAETEFDVDLTTGPITVPEPTGLADLGAMTLVELDDSRVAKDPSQSGMFTATGQPPPPAIPRTLTPVSAPRTVTPPRPLVAALTLPDTLAALARSTSADAATALVMAYAASRWHAALLLAISEGTAVGQRGHGAQLAGDSALGVLVPLTSPSLVQAAHRAGRLITEPPAGGGVIEERLERLLGQPRHPAAAPVVVGDRVAYVLVTGDPRTGDPDDAAADLDTVTTGLGEACARIVREPNRT